MKQFMIGLPEEILAELDRLARSKGLARAALIRMIIIERLKKEAEDSARGGPA